jgi:hypothetical protein
MYSTTNIGACPIVHCYQLPSIHVFTGNIQQVLTGFVR